MSVATIIHITGKAPVRETLQECRWAGYYRGTPIVAKAPHQDWRFIWTGRKLRAPVPEEGYLFR